MKPRQLGSQQSQVISRQKYLFLFTVYGLLTTEAVPIPQVRFMRRDLKDEQDSFRTRLPVWEIFFVHEPVRLHANS